MRGCAQALRQQSCTDCTLTLNSSGILGYLPQVWCPFCKNNAQLPKRWNRYPHNPCSASELRLPAITYCTNRGHLEKIMTWFAQGSQGIGDRTLTALSAHSPPGPCCICWGRNTPSVEGHISNILVAKLGCLSSLHWRKKMQIILSVVNSYFTVFFSGQILCKWCSQAMTLSVIYWDCSCSDLHFASPM